jgi:TDG/mug DNA glycosylase family protein
MSLKSAFPPIAGAGTRVLILGSLPGDRSIAAAEYYAHPGNGFWWLAGEVIGMPLKGLPYDVRVAALLAHGVGLWDVIAQAHRPGSQDSAIRDPVVRDLAAFAASLPELRAIGFNGGMAARQGRRQLAAGTRYTLIDLPSSSGLHARISLDEKRSRWLALRGFLLPAAKESDGVTLPSSDIC